MTVAVRKLVASVGMCCLPVLCHCRTEVCKLWKLLYLRMKPVHTSSHVIQGLTKDWYPELSFLPSSTTLCLTCVMDLDG